MLFLVLVVKYYIKDFIVALYIIIIIIIKIKKINNVINFVW